MTDDADALLPKWRSWIEKDIKPDVIEMHFRRAVWREINKITLANPKVAAPNPFWDFHHENYVVTQAVAVRRQADRRSDVRSLALHAHPPVRAGGQGPQRSGAEALLAGAARRAQREVAGDDVRQREDRRLVEHHGQREGLVAAGAGGRPDAQPGRAGHGRSDRRGT